MSKISPCLWFNGQAEEAARFYVSLLPDSRIDHVQRNVMDSPGGKEGGEEVACGWVKDRYGVSWQIVPSVMPRFLADPDREKAARVMQAMMDMVRLDIAALQAAYDGRS